MEQEEKIRNMKGNIIWSSRTVRLILIYLNKKEIDYASNISREINISLSMVIWGFKGLREAELIESVECRGRKKPPFIYKTKRSKYYRLTERGKRIAGLLFKIDEELKCRKKSLNIKK